VCNLSTIACTTLFPSKQLGCYDDLGAIFSSDPELGKLLHQIARHGQDRRYHHIRVGRMSLLDILEASVLLPKLAILDNELVLRHVAAGSYDVLLGGSNGLGQPEIADHNASVSAQYAVRVANRDAVQASLQEAGVPTAVHYPLPLNRQPEVGLCKCPPDTRRPRANFVLSLPMHPYLRPYDQKKVACSFLMRPDVAGKLALNDGRR
jgi:UDP-2-acetamido-2-deoxy-ribo-hexuluronate aminotransferase